MIEYTSKKILLHLSLIEGIGPVTAQKIISHLTTDYLNDLYQLTVIDLQSILRIPYQTAELIKNGLRNFDLLDKELEKIESHGIAWTTCMSNDYPPILKHIYAPPIIIYWFGSLNINYERSISVIGSREANEYGATVIKNIVPELVAHGWQIISGGARGADTMAHQAALDAGGKTIAVLGSGLLNLFPKSNKKLFEQIAAQDGAVISIFPLTMEPFQQNFPARNRIIAGLSRGCLVVQAAAKSGARITADFALEQGKEVFAIPGSIFDPLSAGCHALIAQGAHITTQTDDILQVFGYEIEQTEKSLQSAQNQSTAIQDSEQNSDNSKLLNQHEAHILSFCNTGISTDELLALTEFRLPELTLHLFNLQVKKYVMQNAAGLWQKQ